MKISFSLCLAALATLMVAGCDSKEERNRKTVLEKQADALDAQAAATRKAAEARADAVEAQKPLVKESIEQAADAERKAGNAAAENLEKRAEATREQK
ncbi:MAG: hypothetical protein U0984_15755 [Prosthecobacter sp.]|nr:hypothetical protein [Prosthecobacter sp.]